jgi:predicted O-methyltransferase YrrM
MVSQLEEILRTGHVRSVDGTKTLPLDSAVTADVGEFLQGLIRQRRPKTTLEVGLAFGISALFICEALQAAGGQRHIAIDPNQSTQWQGIGINNLRQAGFGDMVELHESSSHLALPQLEANGTRIDFAFIDGWHTFDHALTDFFHVDRILSVGGVVVFDDVFFPGVHQACRYVALNRAYTVVGSTEGVADYRPSNVARVLRQAAQRSSAARKILKSKFCVPDETLKFTADCRCLAFEKVSEDRRSWADHQEF